jgi:hypothetical protein
MNGPARVLVVYNAYQHRGGEDAVVDDEIALERRIPDPNRTSC